MRAFRLALLLASVVAGAKDAGFSIKKCCGVFEMLSGDGQSCVAAPWSREHTVQERARKIHENIFHVDLQPDDEPWLSHWLPPGNPPVPTSSVIAGYVNFLRTEKPNLVVRPVESSSVWDERQAENVGWNYWRRRVVFDKNGDILRHETLNVITGSFLVYSYCVDAARPPLAPFALLMEPECEVDDCVTKCCPPRHVMQVTGDQWACRNDSHGYWAPYNSSVARFVPRGLPFENNRLLFCRQGLRAQRLSAGDARLARLVRRRNHNFLFSTWRTCVDLARGADRTLGDTLFYCPKSRITRGVYWVLRPLCFLSASLLAVAVLSVVCNRSLRRKTHGRCLVCHGVCLLAHNVGHIAYYLTISDEIDDFGYVPPHLKTTCPKFEMYFCKHVACLFLVPAFSMYFFLMAANCWLTTLCFNMAMGFGNLHVARPGGEGSKRRFLASSAVAWGLPVLMAGLSALAFENDAKPRRWYSPSFMETRTCYNELSFKETEVSWYAVSSVKYGSALFYYGPVCLLVLINTICIAHTLRKVHFLRRGNHILQRQEDQVSRGIFQSDGDNEQTRKAARSTVTDAKTIQLYVKMLLTTGVAEMFAETLAWGLSYYSREENVSVYEHTLSLRATGYAADCFRAGCVAWLAAPEGGYFGALRRGQGGGGAGRGAERAGASGTTTWRQRTQNTLAPLSGSSKAR